MNEFQNSIFSLSRFFHTKKKTFPCWVAGRLKSFKKDSLQLESQGLSLCCRFKGEMKFLRKGDWLAVKLLSCHKSVYQIKEAKVLSSSHNNFKLSDFSYQKKGVVLKDWRSFLKAIYEFFNSQGLACVETPGLVDCPGTEPHLQAFKTSLSIQNKERKIYLPTSPEMHLKKLLCQDWTDFFEIKKCFRNSELSSIHQVEFTMLEWYRAFYSLNELQKEVYKLLSFLKSKSFFKVSLLPAKVFTVRELFQKYIKFSLKPETSKKELIALLKRYTIPFSPKASFEDLFFLLFLNLIEPKLPKKNPVFICDYPPQLRAFAQIKTTGWADRFELYWQGLELANAFYEVINSQEQKKLFKQHIQLRKDSISEDKELISFMKQGMPPTSGIALGLDRLFLALYKKKDLKQTRLFPL